jgi:hypothetical protein
MKHHQDASWHNTGGVRLLTSRKPPAQLEPAFEAFEFKPKL